MPDPADNVPEKLLLSFVKFNVPCVESSKRLPDPLIALLTVKLLPVLPVAAPPTSNDRVLLAV